MSFGNHFDAYDYVAGFLDRNGIELEERDVRMLVGMTPGALSTAISSAYQGIPKFKHKLVIHRSAAEKADAFLKANAAALKAGTFFEELRNRPETEAKRKKREQDERERAYEKQAFVNYYGSGPAMRLIRAAGD